MSSKAIRVCFFAAILAAALAPGVRAGEEGQTISYEPYARILREYVDARGMVDYEALKANRAPLDRFARRLGRLDRETYEEWTDNEKIAFWINAYNALALKLIIDNYPIEPGFFASMVYPKNSIRQISGAFDGVTFEVMGRDMTLDDIEHGTLREEFNEPRIHLALVCAAKSCPRLRREPYRGEKLDEQLNDQTNHFVITDKFRIDRRDGVVYVSFIFKWFGEDFIPTHGTDTKFQGHGKKVRAMLNFFSEYVPERDRRYLERGDYEVEYLDYDWSLNEQPS